MSVAPATRAGGSRRSVRRIALAAATACVLLPSHHDPAPAHAESSASAARASDATDDWAPHRSPTPSAVAARGPWNLTFADEFTGTRLSNRWARSWFHGGTMNNVATRARNVSVRNGHLVLTLASRRSGALVNTNPEDAAARPFEFIYGYAEARIRFPGDSRGLHNWPAWWLNGQRWPTTGEHDIAEVLGGRLTVTYHSDAGADQRGAVRGRWADRFHTYGIHVRPRRADVYYNDVKVASYATDDGGAPHYLILNIGRGEGSRTVPGAHMKVDYVRVWERDRR